MTFEEIRSGLPPPSSAQFCKQPNPFFEPWILDNARRHLLGPHERFLSIEHGGRITLPSAIDRRVPRWLPPVARVGADNHCFDATPLTQNACLDDLKSVFESLASRGVDILRWRRLPLDTEFMAAFSEFLAGAGLAFESTKIYRRPLLVRDGSDPDAFLSRHISKKRLKDLYRRRQRLGELGKVEFRIHQGEHDAAQWCRDFIDLEASGWKGPSGAGTAIGCSPNERAFFEAVAAEGAAQGRIVVHSMLLDGKPVAMTVNFRSGTWMWAYKSAYRENLAYLAPGVQIEVEGSRVFLSDPDAVCMDSCMASEQGLLAEFWPGRRPVGEFLIAVHPRANRIVRAGGSLWRRFHALKVSLKEKARDKGGFRLLPGRAAGR